MEVSAVRRHSRVLWVVLAVVVLGTLAACGGLLYRGHTLQATVGLVVMVPLAVVLLLLALRSRGDEATQNGEKAEEAEEAEKALSLWGRRVLLGARLRPWVLRPRISSVRRQ